jgi:sarcosine oxidase subunit delta
MKLMPCPLNGPRNISEFHCLGDVKPAVPADATPAEVGRALYLETNLAGVVHEWWIHVPSSYIFIAERDTRTDEIISTMTVDAFERRPRA